MALWPSTEDLEAVLRHDTWQDQHELAALLNVPARAVREGIERARNAGELAIMSGQHGYRLASTPEEYAADIDGRRRRAIVQLVNVRGERRHLHRWRKRLESAGQPPAPPAPEVPGQAPLPW